MNYTASDSASTKKTSLFGAGDVLRELIAAMPIVIFAKAARAALQPRPGSGRTSLGATESQ